jgi:hypothetical protein
MSNTPEPGRGSAEHVTALAEELASQWHDDPNVVQISLCLKVKGGIAVPGAYALGFHVRHKVPLEVVRERGWRVIPEEIEGVLTDVIDTHSVALGSVDARDTRSQLFDTLVGGIAVGNAGRDVYGTLGMTLLAEDGRLVGLTNEHVLVEDGAGKVGDDVVQPRFYLNAEVSLDAADCCPDGQLTYRGVNNPIVDAAVAVFAVAAIAAAASDRIDPHRRGQDATPVASGESTLQEVVHMEIAYPEIPLPGTPFTTGVRWRYERQTDRRVLTHEIEENQQNEHVTDTQILETNQPKYVRGARVLMAAALGPDHYSGRCNYFVTAATISPSGRQAHKIVLRPWQPVLTLETEEFSRLRMSVAGNHQDRERCFWIGSLQLPQTAETGRWRTYLYAQTLNDVPAHATPTEAAKTIGGLPVTANFVVGGRTTNLNYGASCEIRQRTYGSFEVEDDAGPIIG